MNLEFTPAQRQKYLSWMRNTTRQHGVPPQPSYSVAWLQDVEAEVLRSSENE